ncbi:uncharacterized protein LOC144206564 isoform X2 [Stigmatopora nigra]
MDMEDEDGTCLLDVLCDPQALNDFLHGTAELQTEDLLISTSSGAPSLFGDTPSPVSLLGDGDCSPSTPPPGCVDLSFLEEALLSSPEGADDSGGSPVEPECQPKEEVEAKEEVTICDILQQSLKEADITEQTVTQSGESVYPPVTTTAPPPFAVKAVALPRDTQAAVDPPQPSLLAVGPGCPSLKPAPPPQLMGLLPGNVFPAPSPESSLVQGSGMILHKTVTARPLVGPAPGFVLQRAPLPIQPKLSISIQPRLVQISPKPVVQNPGASLALVPGTTSPGVLLSQKPSVQGGSFTIQPQGLFGGQSQFLLPGQTLLTAPVDGSQILAMPQRQLNFGPVFTTTGQLALGRAAILSPAVFQMPAQLAGSYANAGRGGLIRGAAMGNQITLIDGSGVVNSDLGSISIINAPAVARRPPSATRPTQLGTTDVKTAAPLLPEDEKTSEDSILPQVSVQNVAPSPPPTEPPPAPDPPPDVEDACQSLSENHDQVSLPKNKQELVSPVPPDLLASMTPALLADSLTPPLDNEQESQPFSTASEPHTDASPFLSESENPSLLSSSPSLNDSAPNPDPTPLTTFEDSPQPPGVPPQFQNSIVDSGWMPASPAPPPSPSSECTPISGIAVPQQWPDLSADVAVDAPVQMHTQNTPTTALAIESDIPTADIRSPSPTKRQWHGGSLAPRNQQPPGTELKPAEILTPAMRRHGFQQMLCSDHLAVQNPHTSPAFSTLTQAARRLLPYHVCAGNTPSQEDLALVDQEFDVVSRFLLKRSKDMVNKYRQLLVRETWQESPSAEMVMLERLFLQAERSSFGEDRRRAQGDPESFLKSLSSPASIPTPRPANPAWNGLSDRPPGLKTYRSSSRGALRLTIKQERGSRKVVRTSLSRDLAVKRDRTGRPSNGASHPEDAMERKLLPSEAPQRDAPGVKCLKLDVGATAGQPEDSVLNQHLQSAIDSILELRRLQGGSAGSLAKAQDQSVTSAL